MSVKKLDWADEVDDEPLESVTDKQQEEPDEDDGAFQQVSQRKKGSGVKENNIILVFQEAFSNEDYQYSGLMCKSFPDLERLFSKHESKKCAHNGISYKFQYFHGYNPITQTIWSFHHGKLREHKKLIDAEMSTYHEKLKKCLQEY
jgi:hypothetical protein